MLFDTAREEEIGLGRLYDFPPLGYGECTIHRTLAKSIGVTEKG
jgi:hypothetical protein